MRGQLSSLPIMTADVGDGKQQEHFINVGDGWRLYMAASSAWRMKRYGVFFGIARHHRSSARRRLIFVSMLSMDVDGAIVIGAARARRHNGASFCYGRCRHDFSDKDCVALLISDEIKISYGGSNIIAPKLRRQRYERRRPDGVERRVSLHQRRY